jgi:DNA-binding NarL/FixJ family response regulator
MEVYLHVWVIAPAASLNISEGGVRNSISALLSKFNLKDRIQLAVFAIKNDLV